MAGYRQRIFEKMKATAKCSQELTADQAIRLTDEFPPLKSGWDMIPIIESIICDIPRTFIVNMGNGGNFWDGIPLDFEGEHKRWLTFGVPRVWDLLSALSALAAHEYGREPRFLELLQLVLEQQNADGRWLCGSVSRTYPLEKRNRPSKWVTLDVLRLLRNLGYPFSFPA